MVVVFIHDPALRGYTDLHVLRQMYGLTEREALVAADLARGLTLAESAERRGVKTSTVRWHEKRVLAKMNVRNQAELVRTVLETPAFVRQPDE